MIEETRCPHCRAGVVIDSGIRGQETHCPWCQQPFVVPAGVGEPPTSATPAGPPTPPMPQSTITFSDIVAAPMTEAEPSEPATTPVPPMAGVPAEPDIRYQSMPPEEPPVRATPAPSAIPAQPPAGKPPGHAGYDLTEEPFRAELAPEEKPPSPPVPPPLPAASRETMPCPRCAGPILVTPELRGKHVICPHCRKPFTVPWSSARPERHVDRVPPTATWDHRTQKPPSAALPQGCVISAIVGVVIFLLIVVMRGCS